MTTLYGDFRWNADDPKEQASAIVSRLVQKLGSSADSVLHGRISSGEDEKDDLRCITIGSLAKALSHREFFVHTAKNKPPVPGAFWTGDQAKTLRRSYAVVSSWLEPIATVNDIVWAKGRALGGALAMNTGVTIALNVLKSALQDLSSKGLSLSGITEAELITRLEPYATALAQYFKYMDESRLADFRALYGIAGQASGTRDALLALREMIPGFEPAGIREVAEAREQRTNEKALSIISDFERSIRRLILDELKTEYGETEEGWWFNGVPTKVRIRIDKARNESASRGNAPKREEMVSLNEFIEIVRASWEVLGDLFSFDKSRKRDDRLQWLQRLQGIRAVAEDARKDPISPEDLDFVRQAKDWFDERIAHLDGVGS